MERLQLLRLHVELNCSSDAVHLLYWTKPLRAVRKNWQRNTKLGIKQLNIGENGGYKMLTNIKNLPFFFFLVSFHHIVVDSFCACQHGCVSSQSNWNWLPFPVIWFVTCSVSRPNNWINSLPAWVHNGCLHCSLPLPPFLTTYQSVSQPQGRSPGVQLASLWSCFLGWHRHCLPITYPSRPSVMSDTKVLI